jgi:hypothetical protein
MVIALYMSKNSTEKLTLAYNYNQSRKAYSHLWQLKNTYIELYGTKSVF